VPLAKSMMTMSAPAPPVMAMFFTAADVAPAVTTSFTRIMPDTACLEMMQVSPPAARVMVSVPVAKVGAVASAAMGCPISSTPLMSPKSFGGSAGPHATRNIKPTREAFQLRLLM
jgi:hypothetical protein